MQVLVTGGAGFIGSKLVRYLLNEGHEVRATYRTRLPSTAHTRLTWVRADLSASHQPRSDRQAWGRLAKIFRTLAPDASRLPPILPPLDPRQVAQAEALVAGCQVVIHVAARTTDWGPFEVFIADNVLPTQALLVAAKAAGVQRFMYVSSVGVHGLGVHRQTSEEGPYWPVSNPYPISKRLAESLVLRSVREGLDACIVRPGMVYGPDDVAQSYRIMTGTVAGQMGTIDSGRHLACPVYTEDLMTAFGAVLRTKDLAGQTFNIVGPDRLTWRAYCDGLSAALGCAPIKINAPAPLAMLVAGLAELAFGLVGSKLGPPLTRYRCQQLSADYDFSSAKAKQLLGYQPQFDFGRGIAATVEAWREWRSRT